MKTNIIAIVLKKELKDMFRDKKTVILGILIPLVLFPVLFGIMGRTMNQSKDKVKNNLTIEITDKSNSQLGQFIKNQKNVKIIDSKNYEEDVKSGKALIAIDIPENFEQSVNVKETTSDITLTYDNSSQESQMALSEVTSIIDQYSKTIVAKRLNERKIDTSILTPVNITQKTITKESEGEGKMFLSLLLPLLLVIYCVTGPMGPALDLGAGEKERGTLEPLLTTQADRMSLLWGKFLAITIMGFMTAAASIIGIFIAANQNNSVFKGMSSSGVSVDPVALVIIGLLTVLTTMVFGALELSISIYARSFKEAQTYVSPLTIVALIPIYATYMMDAKNIDLVYFNIPLANVTCIMKEVISGIYNPVHIGITAVWICAYIIISILFARYMFSREEVIFRS